MEKNLYGGEVHYPIDRVYDEYEKKMLERENHGGLRKEVDESVPAGILSDYVHSAVVGDVMSMMDVSEFPQLSGMPERVQIILCATACGFSQGFIARALKISQPRISAIVTKYDPGARYRLSEKAKRAFMTRLCEARGLEALSSITPEKLEAASAENASKIAKQMLDTAQMLNHRKHNVSYSTLDSLLDSIPEADVEEC